MGEADSSAPRESRGHDADSAQPGPPETPEVTDETQRAEGREGARRG